MEACRKYKTNFSLALDAGCGPGRTALELCAEFSKGGYQNRKILNEWKFPFQCHFIRMVQFVEKCKENFKKFVIIYIQGK